MREMGRIAATRLLVCLQRAGTFTAADGDGNDLSAEIAGLYGLPRPAQGLRRIRVLMLAGEAEALSVLTVGAGR